MSRIGTYDRAEVPDTIAYYVAVVRPMLLAAGALIFSASAAAQQPATENPDALRPPSLLAYPEASRQREVVKLYLAELARALQSGDTTTLAALVPDSVIPEVEKLTTRSTGCPSLGSATVALGARAMPIGQSIVRLDEVEVVSAGQGDTVALGSARVTADGRTSGVSVALTRSGHARSMGRVQGLLTVLCTVPAISNGNARVQPTGQP